MSDYMKELTRDFFDKIKKCMPYPGDRWLGVALAAEMDLTLKGPPENIHERAKLLTVAYSRDEWKSLSEEEKQSRIDTFERAMILEKPETWVQELDGVIWKKEI